MPGSIFFVLKVHSLSVNTNGFPIEIQIVQGGLKEFGASMKRKGTLGGPILRSQVQGAPTLGCPRPLPNPCSEGSLDKEVGYLLGSRGYGSSFSRAHP